MISSSFIRNTTTVILVCLLALISSCAGMPSAVSPEWTEDMFFKNAQEAMDNNNYKLALYYYEVFSIRYPENIQKGIAAEYEKAFIYYKTGKYKLAKEGFERILKKYEESPHAMLFHPRFRFLCEAGLTNIEKSKAVNNRLFWRIREKAWAEEHDQSLTDSKQEN